MRSMASWPRITLTGLFFFGLSVFMVASLWAQQGMGSSLQGAAPQSDIIETEISPDSIIENDDLDEAMAQDEKSFKLSQEEQQFVRINQSLKNIIEENQKLVKQKDALQKDIEDLRGERMVQETRLRALASERESILKKSQEIEIGRASCRERV